MNVWCSVGREAQGGYVYRCEIPAESGLNFSIPNRSGKGTESITGVETEKKGLCGELWGKDLYFRAGGKRGPGD